MRRPGVLFIAVEVILGAILLPVAVNVATGGSLPQGLGFLKPSAWYVVAALSVIVVGMPVWRYVVETRVPTAIGYSRFHRETQRRRVLDRLTQRVTGELAKALEDIPWVPPSLARADDAVMPSADLVPADPVGSLPANIRQAFDQYDRSLLILGTPGAGKTTLLLELARHLLEDVTEQDSPIPVILRLARWKATADTRHSRWPWLRRWMRRPDARYFARWCVSEMTDHNNIPRRLATTWLDIDDGVILLLDGLDEMPELQRRGFIGALDEVQRQRGPLAIAVTCRTADYARIRPPLGLQGAVRIEPLDRPRIEEFLAGHDVTLAGLREALVADDALWTLVDSPLLLALLAAQVRTRNNVPSADGEPKVSTSRLLERYINVALASRPFPARIPFKPATLRGWLTTFARAATPSGLLHWSRAWSTTESRTLACDISPGLAVGSACGLLAVCIVVGPPTPLDASAAVALIAVFGTAGIRSVRFETQGTRERASRGAVAAGWAIGLLFGGLAAASLQLLRLSLDAAWWIAGPFLLTGVYSLIYQATRGGQETHPERVAETDRYYRETADHQFMTGNYLPGTARSRTRVQPTRFTLYVAMGSTLYIMWLLIIGKAAAAVTLGIAAGTVLEGSIAAVRRIAGLPGRHPVALLVRALNPWIVLAVIPVLSYVGLYALTFRGVAALRWADSVARSTADAYHWPFALAGVLLGFVSGQVVAYRFISWDRIGTSLADTAARSWLTHGRRMPWRFRRYLTFVAGTGILRDSPDGYYFRHELLAEHCRENGAAARVI